jgi:cytochrome P450
MRFNPLAPSFRADPYPQYAALREAPPVRTLGMWVLTRHADVVAVLRDRSVSAELIPQVVARRGPGAEAILRLGRASLVFTDDPAHARLRGLVNRVFTTAAVEELTPLVEAAVDTRTAGLAGTVELMAAVADPLPIEVLCTWLGLPTALHGRVARWTHEVRLLLEPGLMTEDDLARVAAVVETFAGTLADVRTAGLLHELRRARTAGGDRLSEEEVAFLGIMCFVAGTETSAALIGNAVLALLAHPDQVGAARARPAAAVREVLRHDSPLQMTTRRAGGDLVVGDARIAAGEQLLLCLGAANRDPRVFGDPDRFDVDRPPGPHLGFGFGMHGCLGGALAELVAGRTLGALLERGLRPAGPVRRRTDSGIVRGPAELPVQVGP